MYIFSVFRRITLNDLRMALANLGMQSIVLTTKELKKLRTNNDDQLIYMPTRCYGTNREQTNWIGISFTRIAKLAAALNSSEGQQCYEHSYLNKTDEKLRLKIPEKTNNSPFIYKSTGDEFETRPIISHAWARVHLVKTWIHWSSAIIIAAQTIHEHDSTYQRRFRAWKNEGIFIILNNNLYNR